VVEHADRVRESGEIATHAQAQSLALFLGDEGGIDAIAQCL